MDGIRKKISATIKKKEMGQKLNVGVILYQTTMETLKVEGNISRKINIQYDETFIDRDRHLFHVVLNYLCYRAKYLKYSPWKVNVKTSRHFDQTNI